MSLAAANAEVTLTLVNPWLLLDGLALLAIAMSALMARRRLGTASAFLFALGLLPLALRRLLVGAQDLWLWTQSVRPPAWLEASASLPVGSAVASTGLALSAVVSLIWAFRVSRASRRLPAGTQLASVSSDVASNTVR